MRPFSPKTMPSPPSRRRAPLAATLALLAAPLAIAGAIAGCGGAANMELQSDAYGAGSKAKESPAGTAVAATEPPPFMTIGEIINVPLLAAEPAPTAMPIATAASNDADGKGERRDVTKPIKTSATKATDKSDSNTRADPGPPPPPPPPGGGTAAGAVQGAVVDSQGGLSEAEVRATIVQRQSSFRECYDIGSQGASSGFSGTVTVRAAIGPNGAVASVDVVNSTTKNTKVDTCVVDAVRRIQFPSKGGGAVIAFPIQFGS